MRKPYISRRPDLYLSPVEVESAGAAADSVVWLARGQSVVLAGAVYAFKRFRLESKQGFHVYADVEVRHGGHVAQVTPGMVMDGAARRPPGGGRERLGGARPANPAPAAPREAGRRPLPPLPPRV